MTGMALTLKWPPEVAGFSATSHGHSCRLGGDTAQVLCRQTKPGCRGPGKVTHSEIPHPRLRGEWAQKLELRHRALQAPLEAAPRASGDKTAA